MSNKKSCTKLLVLMASQEVWEFYRSPPRARENAKDKNPKWEVSNVLVVQPKPHFLKSKLCENNLG